MFCLLVLLDSCLASCLTYFISYFVLLHVFLCVCRTSCVSLSSYLIFMCCFYCSHLSVVNISFFTFSSQRKMASLPNIETLLTRFQLLSRCYKVKGHTIKIINSFLFCHPSSLIYLLFVTVFRFCTL